MKKLVLVVQLIHGVVVLLTDQVWNQQVFVPDAVVALLQVQDLVVVPLEDELLERLDLLGQLPAQQRRVLDVQELGVEVLSFLGHEVPEVLYLLVKSVHLLLEVTLQSFFLLHGPLGHFFDLVNEEVLVLAPLEALVSEDVDGQIIASLQVGEQVFQQPRCVL